MKAAPFEYVDPENVDEAIAALAADEDAKVIAGGQSLVPLLALRLARPSVLVDLRRVGLDDLNVTSDAIEIGASVRHRTLERDPRVLRETPLLARAARHIGHAAIRNRGTIGGSAAHADPAAELPAALVTLGAGITVRGIQGTREIAAADLFEGYFTTTLTPDEIVTHITVPRSRPRTGAAFEEWAPRLGDFALAGVALELEVDESGIATRARAAACGVGSVPVDLSDALDRAGVIGGEAGSESMLRAVATTVETTCAGNDDAAELAGLLAARALAIAFQAAGDRTAADAAA